jgi:hypothetical protein
MNYRFKRSAVSGVRQGCDAGKAGTIIFILYANYSFLWDVIKINLFLLTGNSGVPDFKAEIKPF